MKQSLKQWTPVVALLALSACGPMKQDPLADYPLTRNSRPVERPEDLIRQEPQKRIEYVPQPVEKIVTKTEYVPKEVEKVVEKIVYVDREVPVEKAVYYEKTAEQNYAAAQLFQINAAQSVNFIAGVESQVNFEIRMLQGQIDYNASLLDLNGAKFDLISDKDNKRVYRLTYKPSVDSLAGDRIEKTENLKIVLDIKSIKDANADKQKRLEQAFAAVTKVKSFEYTIRRDRRQPTVELVNFPSSIQEGDKKTFTIKVKAPGTYAGLQPQLYWSYDDQGFTGGLFENNGTPFIRPIEKKGQSKGEGEWTFEYEVNTQLFAIPAQLNNQLQPVANADSVQLRATLKVLVPGGSSSDDKVVKFKIGYKKETATASAH